MTPKITVTTTVQAPIETVWKAWTAPEHITRWNAASADWHCPRALNDLRAGGRFNARMEARDGSMGFDFEGEYTEIIPQQKIAYIMDDQRKVVVTFAPTGTATQLTETFDAETENSLEMQQAGWQSILDHFRVYVEALSTRKV